MISNFKKFYTTLKGWDWTIILNNKQSFGNVMPEEHHSPTNNFCSVRCKSQFFSLSWLIRIHPTQSDQRLTYLYNRSWFLWSKYIRILFCENIQWSRSVEEKGLKRLSHCLWFLIHSINTLRFEQIMTAKDSVFLKSRTTLYICLYLSSSARIAAVWRSLSANFFSSFFSN